MTVKTKLGRNAAHRKAMLRTMVTQLFQHERIQTTLPKAKQLRKVADRMITLAKRDTRGALAKLTGYVRTEREQHKVLTVLATRYANRQGGYTRVLRCGIRRHDAAPMAFIELVDRPGELRPARPGTGHGFIPPAARLVLQQSSSQDSSSSSSLSAQQGLQLQQQRSVCSQALPFSSSGSSSRGCSSGSLQPPGIPTSTAWWHQPQAQVQRWQQLRALSSSCAGAAAGTLDSHCTHTQQQQRRRRRNEGDSAAAAPGDVAPSGWWVRSWRSVLQQLQVPLT